MTCCRPLCDLKPGDQQVTGKIPGQNFYTLPKRHDMCGGPAANVLHPIFTLFNVDTSLTGRANGQHQKKTQQNQSQTLHARTPKGMFFGGFVLHKTNQKASFGGCWCMSYLTPFQPSQCRQLCQSHGVVRPGGCGCLAPNPFDMVTGVLELFQASSTSSLRNSRSPKRIASTAQVRGLSQAGWAETFREGEMLIGPNPKLYC